MKRSTLLSLTVSTLLATNGDHLVGAGPNSRSLAGNALTIPSSAESIFLNPALLCDQPSSIEGAFTLFKPFVTVTTDQRYGSKEPSQLIPFAGAIYQTSQATLGVGLMGVGGMGVDYSHYPQLYGLKTKMSFAKFGLALAKKHGDFSFGVGMDMAYGRLLIQDIRQSEPTREDMGAGYHLGFAYTSCHLHLGATYTSKISMHYQRIYDFDQDGRPNDLHLAQPAQIALGLGWQDEKLMIEADIKKLFWAKAQGYKDFGWRNQNIFGIGVAYQASSRLQLRAGYSYATALFDSFADPKLAFFNLVGFPALSRTHIATGLRYRLDRHISLDVAVLYAPKMSKSAGLQATNRQSSLTLGVSYAF